MEVWPFVPDRSCTETAEWLTEIQRTPTKERRAALRTLPRYELSYSFKLTPEVYSAAKLQARRLAADYFFIPMWTEAHRIASIGSGTTALSKEAADPFYPADSYVLVYESDSKYEVREVQTAISPHTQITLKEGVVNAYTNPLVMPLRVANFSQPFSAPRTDGKTAYVVATARFLVEDGDSFSTRATGLYLTDPTYLGARVVLDRASVSASVTEQIQQPFKILDTEVGASIIVPTATTPHESSTVAWLSRSNSERWDLLFWLHSRRGRQKSFWLPSWNKDVILVSAATAASYTLTVESAGFSAAVCPMHCAAFKRDGSHFFFTVEGASPAGGGHETLLLASALGEALQVWEVDQICIMRKVRFDSDRIEMRRSSNGIMRVSVPTVEVPE